MKRLTHFECEKAVVAVTAKKRTGEYCELLRHEQVLRAFAESTGRRLPDWLELDVAKRRFYSVMPLTEHDRLALREHHAGCGWDGGERMIELGEGFEDLTKLRSWNPCPGYRTAAA
jgi:hypothetical protein